MDSTPANEAQCASMAQAEMQKAVNCLALELPASVHEDVVRRWDELECAMRDYLAKKDAEITRLRALLKEAEPWLLEEDGREVPCPFCNLWEMGKRHTPDCRLAKELKDE